MCFKVAGLLQNRSLARVDKIMFAAESKSFLSDFVINRNLLEFASLIVVLKKCATINDAQFNYTFT